MRFEIRKIRKSDIAFLKDMVYESAFVPEGQMPFPRTILNEPSVSKYVDRWGERNGDIGLIAEIGKQSIGAIWLRLFDEMQRDYGDEKTPEFGMAVVKEFRGKGIGRSLLCALEQEASNYEYQRLCLSVDPRNPARRLYERFGYERVGMFETFWIMEKKLNYTPGTHSIQNSI